MKNIIATLVLLFTVSSFSQTINGVPFSDIDTPFIEIVGTGKLLTNKVSVEIDFGQRTKFFGSAKKQTAIVDAQGNKVVFNSMIDALNFMTTNGYKFEQAYAVTIGNTNVYHYLLSKE